MGGSPARRIPDYMGSGARPRPARCGTRVAAGKARRKRVKTQVESTRSTTLPTRRVATAQAVTLWLAWAALIGNVIVILQGAIVRGTGSGAGCGSHWPTCNGSVVPLDPSLETLIEFSHRLLSGGVLVLGIVLLLRTLGTRRENPGLAVFAGLSFGFLVFEALIGGATVLLGMTGENTSVARGVWVASHLVNSMLLVGMLAGTVVYARRERPAYPLRLGAQASLTAVTVLGLGLMLVLMFTGGIAAMGNTMFPSESLSAGLRADFDSSSHLLIRLRILHPLIAIGVGTYLFVSLGMAWWLKSVPLARRTSQALLVVYVVQLVIGVANLTLLAPLALQVVHLAVAVAAYALLSATTIQLLGGRPAAPVPGATSGAVLENARP